MCAEYDQRMSKAVEVVRRYTGWPSSAEAKQGAKGSEKRGRRFQPFEPPTSKSKKNNAWGQF
jgi:hypothetical protein